MERDFIKSSSSKDKGCQMWVVASGKGGVGKTFVTSSLAISLSKMGHTVVVVDLDLSGANIHTSFGVAPASTNIRHFFEGSKTLPELLIPTGIPRVSFVQGFWDGWAPTDLSIEQIRTLVPAIKKINADFVLV